MTEEQRAKRRAYYQKNKAKILAYQKQWRSENSTKVAKYQLKTWQRKTESQQKVLNENN